ncbi:substrate-binding domain-containing protein, partial [Serratia liquefaciens]
VIGFDDIPLAPYTVPSLSSMKMPVTEMIQETINRLLSMLDGGELSKRPSFPASLIERESVAAGPYERS